MLGTSLARYSGHQNHVTNGLYSLCPHTEMGLNHSSSEDNPPVNTSMSVMYIKIYTVETMLTNKTFDFDLK